MMKKIFAMVLVAAMVMMMGTCTLAENVITQDTSKEIAQDVGIVKPPWD